MKSSGSFVLNDIAGGSLWSSGTSSNGAYLLVKNDGNMVINRSNGTQIWQSNTCCH
jgi:hypothetical protein